jgi:hypothetical protein
MNQVSPSPEDARASLQEAGSRAATIRRTDSRFKPILLLITAAYLVIGALVSASPRGGNAFVGVAVIVTFLAGFGGALYLMLRMKAWSRTGILWFVWSVALFVLWNSAVIWVSFVTGWWARNSPGIHFGGSVLVAVIPLIVAAWLLGRR